MKETQRTPLRTDAVPDIALVRATARDIDEYLDIERSIPATRVYSPQLDRAEELMEIERNAVYLIRENGRTVGSIEYELKSPDRAYISGLALRPDAQGRGIGKAALIRVLEELTGIRTVYLVTHPENSRAVALYASLGFIPGERIENYSDDGEPRVVMTLSRN